MDLVEELNSKITKTYLNTELGKKASQSALSSKTDKTYVDTELKKKTDQSALDSKVNIEDIIPKKDLKDILDAKANKSELSGESKEYIDNALGKKADKSDIEELRKEIKNLGGDDKNLSKSIYVQAVLTEGIKPWTKIKSSFLFKNLKIQNNTDNLGKSDKNSFTFTATEKQNYLIDASITIKLMRETTGVGLPTFIYKIQVFRENKWQDSKIMQWQYNGVTQKDSKASKDPPSKGTLKSTDIIQLQKDEKIQFILECKTLIVSWNDISIQLPTSFVICSLN